MEKDLKEAAFCANIYGCKAGSNLWHTAAEYDQGTCNVCPEDASPLFPRQDLIAAVESCPLCAMVLSPLKHNNQEEWISGQSIARSFEHKPENDLEEPCLICGSEPKTILKWMDRDGVLNMRHHPHLEARQRTTTVEADTKLYRLPETMLEQVSEAKVPDLPFLEAVNILATMNQNLNNKEVFSTIKKTTTSQELMNWSLRDYETILRVFPDGSNFSRVLRKRMLKLWSLIEDLKQRKKMWLSKHKE
jgi:hypothetical protein